MKKIILSLVLLLSVVSVKAQSDTLTPELKLIYLLDSFQVTYSVNDTSTAALLTELANECSPYTVNYDVEDMHKIKRLDLCLFREVTYCIIEKLEKIVNGTYNP